jgi:uncharacterized protein YggT (Ycf19 family)
MTEHVQHIRRVRDDDRDVDRNYIADRDPAVIERAHGQHVAARIVWFVTGVLLTILALRFILSLLGANPNNQFADFIYTISHPFVSPFFGLFNYDFTNGVSHFEAYTLVAMIVYALIGYGIARLLTINRPVDPVDRV